MALRLLIVGEWGGEGGTFFFVLRDLLKVLVKWNIF